MYEPIDLERIIGLVKGIKYTEGFLDAMKWEDNPQHSNLRLAEHYAQDLIEDLTKLKEYSKNVRKLINFNKHKISRLETLADRFLRK